jgi:FkbM family methyltransferase
VEAGVPDLEGLDPDLARRVLMTVSCSDSEDIPKVDGAGEVREYQRQRVQVMHNGLLVEEGGYYGRWMAEIIRILRGHHEPQEEKVFDQIIRRLVEENRPGAMIEFGAFWTYYGLWFCREVPRGRAVAVEPDPAYLQVGRRNAALNELSEQVTFIQAAIGDRPGVSMTFRAESDDSDYQVDQCDLNSVMHTAGLERVDLVLADVQGAETLLLERGRDLLRDGKVRFLIVATHHHLISGDPLTHQRALRLLTDIGAHVIAEHSVSESYAGDGLIAVSFDPLDRDLVVDVSRARSKESLFGELEYDVNALHEQRDQAYADAAHKQHLIDALHAERTETTAGLQSRLVVALHDREVAVAELTRVKETKVWRWSRWPRHLYTAVRSRRLAGR